jgi:3-hydroxyisobutyrate dehydrogenase
MKIGVAGLGLMGSGMASRLVSTGHKIFVYNRSKTKTEQFLETSTIASSPKELADNCDFVIIVVTDFTAVWEVLFGKDGIVESANHNIIVADASTISPSQSEYCARSLRQKGIEMLGMPVMGGPASAQAGNLIPIIAGNKETFEKVEQIIESIGKPVYIGNRDGAANAIKLALNLNIALIATAISEGITLVKASDIDPEIFIHILNLTYFKTGLSEKKGPNMAKGDFNPSFYLRNMLKDLDLAANAAQSAGVTLPHTSLAQQLFRAANNSGFSDKDYTAICSFLAKINGIEK